MSEASQAREASMGFEAKKDRLSQTQDGLWKVTFTVKPEDMQTAILNASMGTRYMLAAVEIGDNEEAVPQDKTAGERAKGHFETMCDDQDFRDWIWDRHRNLPKYGDDSEDPYPGCRQYAKRMMHIQSANELLENPEPWQTLYDEFKYRDSVK